MAVVRKAQDSGTIELTRLADVSMPVLIEGKTPLIPHRWSEKAKRMMPGHPERSLAKVEKGVRQREEEAEACLYRLEDGRTGMPATAFKAAMVAACRFFEKPSMTEGKLLFYVEGEGAEQLVPVEGPLTLREDTPRNATGVADLRYRYAIFPWKAVVKVRFVPTRISPSSVVNLLDAAGRVGIGDWRPSSPKSASGTFGQWGVVEE